MTTKIEWTNKTWNPSSGCDRVTPGCDNCYALAMAKRLKAIGTPGYQSDGDPRTSGPGFGVTTHADRLDQPLRWRKPQRVFVDSMGDLFHDDVPDEFIARVWQAMGAAPQHTYQVLTKRHGRMRSWTRRWYSGEIAEPYAVAEVTGYPGYRVTTTGKVLGRRPGAHDGLAEDVGEHGHRRVTMYRGGSGAAGERELVHRLVLTAFSRPPRAGEQACHRNGDAGDNRWSNLYWGTAADNWRDRAEHGRRRSYTKVDLEQVATIRSRVAAGESAYAVARDYPISDTQVRNIVNKAQWQDEPPPYTVVPPARAVLGCVWLGVSVEDQQRADLRVPALLGAPAAVRFLSCEPLLGPVDLSMVDWNGSTALTVLEHPPNGIDWVIAGGESGPRARPMHPDWARSLRDQCTDAGVPFFFKQWGEWGPAPWTLPVASPSDPFGNTSTHAGLARAKVDSEKRGATHCVCPDGSLYEPTHKPWSLERVGTQSGAVRRWGTAHSGRMLDGRTWDEAPDPVVPAPVPA